MVDGFVIDYNFIELADSKDDLLKIIGSPRSPAMYCNDLRKEIKINIKRKFTTNLSPKIIWFIKYLKELQ